MQKLAELHGFTGFSAAVWRNSHRGEFHFGLCGSACRPDRQLFTLSEGTRAVLGKLNDKTRLKFYFSRSMGNVPFLYKQYGKRVEEFLGEYVAASGGRLELEILDPQP